ncbi:MAG TPA: MarR family transcriptional regulator [Deltaproteobacteria bacterium]|nr:MarR family transcriptional regulator [Deltaproteobacteria bacterium]
MESGDLQQKFRAAFGLAYQRVNALQRDEKRCFGVSLSRCVTLETLLAEGPLPVRGLADRLGLDASTVTRSVDGMVRDGLVRRSRDERGDRRRVYVALTPSGRTLARKLVRCADEYSDRILERIPPERREDVLYALGLLVDAVDGLQAGHCGMEEES